ncbi:AMP-binding protein [Actinosynnema sp. NPDC053489]|uniref:AMP-binding protein n=1 Tax=Actinosynnema sp. NPDC053489 TaxID=3363916 RepID=UPI0037C9717F
MPTCYGRLIAHPGSDRPASLRLAATGGEVLGEALERRLAEVLGDRLLNGIGTTEVGQAFTHNTRTARRFGTVGRALPPFEVRVVDDGGAPVEPDVPGRPQVRDPTITLGVDEHGRPRRTANRYATGDLASVDADGHVRVTGRLDDIENVRAHVVRLDGPPRRRRAGHSPTTLARDHLTAYKVPREVVSVPSLPRTGSGKLRRHVVRTWKP